MSAKNVFIVHPANAEQANALKAFAKALKIKFEVAKEKPYDPEFVSKVLHGEKDFENGNFKVIKTENLWK